MLAGEFIRFLWATVPLEAPGAVTIWRSSDKSSIHIPLKSLSQPPEPGEDEELFQRMGRGNLYAAPGLRRPGLVKRGTKRDVIALGAFVLDIDTAAPPGAHKAPNEVLPKTEDDVLAILEVAPCLPSVIVHSGFGFQPWWVFQEPLWIESDVDRSRVESAYESFEAPFRSRAKELGFKLDKTSTLDHVFRLPNTQNVKLKDNIRDVVVIDGTFARCGGDIVPKIARRVVAASTAQPLGSEEPAPAPSTPKPVASSATAEDLEGVRASMKKLRPGHEHKKMIDAILSGESFAEPGARDDAMYKAASTIAWLTAARKKTMTAEVLAELLRPSLEVWAAEPGAEKTVEEEMEKAVTKFESAIDNRAAKEEADMRSADAIYRGLRMGKYAPKKGVLNGSVAQLAVIQERNKVYVWNFAEQDVRLSPEGYRGPFDREMLYNICKDLWSNASQKFDLTYTDKGQEKNKTDRHLIEEYGTAALSAVGEFSLQSSFFDIETRVFHRAMCPMRPLEPRFDPTIAEWFKLLGASNPDKFLDWVATIPKLDEQNSALYIEGIAGVGKNLFASGSSRLWRTTGPSKYENISGPHNADMFACPMVYLDEGVSVKPGSSAFIRSLIGSSEHTCNQKYVPVHKVIGCVRLIIAANNETVLTQLANEDLSEADLDAVAGRFLHIKATPEAADFIRAHKAELKSWLQDDRISRHILHLANTREVVPGKRFLVEGLQSAIHRALIDRGDKTEIVLEWLTSFVMDPMKVIQSYKAARRQPLALVGDGGVYVNTKALVDNQSLFRKVDEKRQLLPGVIARILARLAGGRQKRFGEQRYHAINPTRIYEWAERTQIGDIEGMKANVEKSLGLE